MRHAEIQRQTKETQITVSLNLEGGPVSVQTGIGFFDHMLTSFGVHAGFGLEVTCKGDLQVDGHHTVEDTGIVLGQAFAKAIGDKAGIARYGSAEIPMDEALGRAVLDISGRPFLRYNACFPEEMCGTFATCLTVEFLRAFAQNAGITLHISAPYGENSHHMIEAMFKALAHALKGAVRLEGTQVLSTKGTLESGEGLC